MEQNEKTQRAAQTKPKLNPKTNINFD